MRRTLEMTGELILLGLGIAGITDMMQMHTATAAGLTAAGGTLFALRLLSFTFVKANTHWPVEQNQPTRIQLGIVDYLKALVAWLLGFRRTYAAAPGLYYTGDRYDPERPLLVTANYHLSVFLVVRRVRRANARVLVIDTDGINVWCAAGKGRFGNEEILKQLRRYPHEVLSKDARPTLILPKFGMSGVRLQDLRDEGLRPIVGPLYAKDLPKYLDSARFRNRAQDRVRFSLQSRAFVWLPGLLQLSALSAMMAATVWVLTLPWKAPFQLGIIGITATLATVYALFFPIIPGRRFAVKGLLLGLLSSAVFVAIVNGGTLLPSSTLFVVPFTIAAGVLIGLEFTGNSAVSNYSKVKREIVGFLPVSIVLFVVSAGTFFAMGVLR